MIKRLFFPIIIRWRAFLRSRTKPISVDNALEKTELLSKLYFFSAFALMVTMTFLVLKNNVDFPYDTTLPKEEAIAKTMKSKNFKFIHYKGLKEVENVTYTQDDEGNYSKEEK